MNILIRDVSPETIYAIDRMVKKLNEKSPVKVSRNDFLKNEIEEIPLREMKKQVDSDVSYQLKEMVKYIKADKDALNKIFYLLTTGDNGDAGEAGNLLESLGSEYEEDDEQ